MMQDGPTNPTAEVDDPAPLAHQRAREALTRVEEMGTRVRAPGGTDPLAAAHRQAREAMIRVEEISAQFRKAIMRADNRDRTVRITINPSGEITELYLDPSCMQLAPEDLAREITTVHHAAIVQAQQMADAAFGEETGLPAEVAAQARRGEIDVRGMLESIGLGSVLGSVEKLGGGKLA